MCEAVTAMTWLQWLQVGAMALTAAAGVQTARAQSASAEFQEEQAKENARLAEAQARNAELAGQVEEDRQRQLTRKFLASQRTAIAANNLDMSTGTPLDILGDTAALGEQDALMIRANAAREAWGFRTQAVDFRNSGSMARAAGRNAARGTYLTTAASLMDMASAFGGSTAPAGATNVKPNRKPDGSPRKPYGG